MDDPQNKARIEANVRKMMAAQAAPEEIEAYLQGEGLRATERPQPLSHAERLQRKMARQALNESEQVDVGGEIGKGIAGGFSSGLGMLPGGQAAMAGIMSGVGGQSFDEALKQLEEAQAKSPAFLRNIAKTAGVAGSMGAVPLRVLQGGRTAGAIFGGGMAGAQRLAEAQPERLSDRLLGTAKAAGIGAGLGYSAPWLMANPFTRTALGAIGGGIAGSSLAPEGSELSGAATGAALGAGAMASPSTTARLLSRASQRVAPRFAEAAERLSQATGLRGYVNRELRGQQDILDATRTGAIVGRRGGGAAAMNAAKEAQQAAADVNYGAALDEGQQAWLAYQNQRGDVIDENVRRMLAQLQQEAQEAAEQLSSTTTQSATGAPIKGRSIRDALNSLRERSAEAARRRGPEGPVSPFAGQSPRAQNVVEQQREAMFDREALGMRQSELGRTAGAGEPEFVDPQHLRTVSGRADVSQMPAPYRPETTQAGIDEMRGQSAGIGDRFSVTTPRSSEPQLQFAEPTQRVVRRGTAESVRVPPAGPRLNETPSQTMAREAMERRAAYKNLPETVKPVQSPIAGQMAVPPEVHPAVAPMYENPVIARAGEQVRKLSQFRGMSPDDPRFIDELYKVISDQKMALGARVEGAAGPVNFLRASKQEMQDAQDLLLQTTDQLMPTYREAVNRFALDAGKMKAFMRGYNAVRGAMTPKGMLKSSPEAIERWIAIQKDPELVNAARQGARYATADAASGVPLGKGRAGLVNAKPFRQSADDAARRGLTGLPELEPVVARVREEAWRDTPKQMRLWLPGAEGHAVASVVNSMFAAPMEKQAAQKILNEVLQNPEAYQQVLQKYSTGKAMTDKMTQLFATQFGAIPSRGK